MLGVRMPPRKVIDIPEEQFVGALERQVEQLSDRVEGTLREGERERDGRSLADEAERLLRRGAPGAPEGEAMAMGVGERPEKSVSAHLAGMEFPADREELVQAVEDAEAPLEVINFFKSLPRERYDSAEMVQRDLAEAARRFGMGGHAPLVGSVDRRNLGRDAVEENVDGNPKHP